MKELSSWLITILLFINWVLRLFGAINNVTPMVDDFFAGSKKINVTLYSWFEPGLPVGSEYPDPKACNFMRFGTFTNNGYPVMNGYQFGGDGCETYHISYDKQTRTITFATQNHCH